MRLLVHALAIAALLLPVPGLAAGQPVAPVRSAAATAALAACGGSCSLVGFSGVSTVAGYFLVLDGVTAAPADGAVAPVDCFPYPTANQPLGIDYSGAPLRALSGLVIVFSTTGCFTKTASATAYISAKVIR